MGSDRGGNSRTSPAPPPVQTKYEVLYYFKNPSISETWDFFVE